MLLLIHNAMRMVFLFSYPEVHIWMLAYDKRNIITVVGNLKKLLMLTFYLYSHLNDRSMINTVFSSGHGYRIQLNILL